MENKISNIKYALVESNSPGKKQVLITYELGGKPLNKSIMLDEKEGATDQDYIHMAEQRFNEEMNKPSPNNNNKPKSLALKIVAVFASVAAIVFASLFTWKMLTSNSGGGGDIPVVDEVTTTLTYSYSPYRTEEGANKLTISFEAPEETPEIEDPPFVGDVYIQWNKDDTSTKQKIEAGTKKIEFDYATRYVENNPKEYTAILSGDVRTFIANARDFYGNNFITSINFGKSIRRLYQASFNDIENLTYVHIGGQVRVVECLAFANCTNLTRVDFSTTDETDRLDIAHAAFMCCNKLRTINFPKRLSYIGPMKECRALEVITIPQENEYFTTLHSNENNELEECGILVTKKDVISPFEFDPEEAFQDPNFSKDTVVASTVYPYIYDGIKSIQSLSGVDVYDLRIPASVESINAHELATSRIDHIHVTRGNQHFTDLYQSDDYDETANVLAQLTDKKELSIIKVGNKSKPINELGKIYVNDELHEYPVTDFAYGAANNSTITSLDLPATLKTFSFDDYIDQGSIIYQHSNPFFTTLKDLTIRAITPPTYVPVRMSTEHINGVFGIREDKVFIYIPEEGMKNYLHNLDPEQTAPSPGYWNLSDNFDIDTKEIRFSYNTLDSTGLASRKEALNWVKTNYTQRSPMEFAAINRWDFTPLIDAQARSQTLYNHLKDKLKKLSEDSYDVNRIIAFSYQNGASCNPNGMGDFRNISVPPLNANNFDSFFKTYTSDITPQVDFTFSIKDGCLEAIQCPNLYQYFEDSNILLGEAIHTMKFNRLGYLMLSRVEFKNLTYTDSSGEIFRLNDIYYSIENYGPSADNSLAANWVDEHTAETRKENIYSRNLDWSYSSKSGGLDFNYNKITGENEFNCITNYMRTLCLKCSETELPIDSLFCEKNKKCVYENPLEVQQITRSYVEGLSNAIFGISEDGNRLCIIERYDLNPLTSGSMNGMAVKIHYYNEVGILEKESFYLFDARVQNFQDFIGGYLESTNIFTE